jgi:hypothetical protein
MSYLKTKNLLKLSPICLHFLSLENNSDYSFKYGVCALYTYADKTKPIRYFEYAVKDPNVDPRAYFYFAKSKALELFV